MNGTESNSLVSAALMFSWVEYSVFCSMLLLSLLIGVYYGWCKRQDTVAEYMLGGKNMSIFPVTLSVVASYVSGITLIGFPAEVYSYGTQFYVVIFTDIAMYFIVNYLYLPVFYNLQMNSLYEYLELRFSKFTRTLASLIFAISLIIFLPVVIYVPALAFNQVAGVPVHVISPIVTLICIFYTSFGGLKAVVWTDALQSFFILGSTIFVVILGLKKIGSISEVMRINEEGGRFEMFNMNPSPFERNTFWTIAIGSIFIWIPQLAVHPGAMQRFIAVPSFKKAKAVMFWSVIGFLTIYGLVLIIGLLLYATYYDCDPVASGVVEKTGQLVPYYVMEVAHDYPGLTGLFISGVLSAALSSISSGLNTVAGTMYEDFFGYVLKGKKLSEARQNCITKIFVLVLGSLCILGVFVIEKLGAIFQMVHCLVGATNGSLSGLFTLGIFFPQANAKGAIAGTLTSLVVMSVVVFGAQVYSVRGLLKYPGKMTSVINCSPDLITSLPFNATSRCDTYTGIGSPVIADPSVPLIFQLSYLYYCLLGMVIVLVVGLAVSYITGPTDARYLDPHLFSPPVRRFLPKVGIKSTPETEEYILVKTSDITTNNNTDGKRNSIL